MNGVPVYRDKLSKQTAVGVTKACHIKGKTKNGREFRTAGNK
jgi:hypothetical protein